jgi:hypothetical protein
VIPASGSLRRGRASSPPFDRGSRESYGDGARGRSAPRWLASIVCVGHDGPTFQGPTQLLCAAGSSVSPPRSASSSSHRKPVLREAPRVLAGAFDDIAWITSVQHTLRCPTAEVSGGLYSHPRRRSFPSSYTHVGGRRHRRQPAAAGHQALCKSPDAAPHQAAIASPDTPTAPSQDLCGRHRIQPTAVQRPCPEEGTSCTNGAAS